MTPSSDPTDPEQARARWHWTLPRVVIGAALALGLPCDLDAQTAISLTSAIVKRCSGSVLIEPKNGATELLQGGATLRPGDKLLVGANGSTELELPGAGTARVEADSEVKVPEANGKIPPQESLEMLKGKLFLNINAQDLKKQGNREFRLKTPTTVLAVKGTKFFALVSAQGDILGTHEGMVLAYEPLSKQSRQLKAGTAVEASPNKLSAPRALRPVEQAYGFIYPGAPVLGWVVPIGNGDRCLTIGFIQSGNGDRYYLRRHPAASFVRNGVNNNDALWKESRSGKRELVFQCQDGKPPSSIEQILAGPDDTIYVTSITQDAMEPGLYKVVGSSPRLVSKRSAWIGQLEQTDGKSLLSVSFGRTNDGTVDLQSLYFNAGKGIYRTTLASRAKASPPVLAYPNLTPVGLTMVGANDVYVAKRHFGEAGEQSPGGVRLVKATPDALIQHLKDSQDRNDLTTIAQLPVFPDVVTTTITMGVWPIDEKPKPRP